MFFLQALGLGFLADTTCFFYLIFMQEESVKYSRTPNVIEQFIIERCVRNTRKMYIESFILFLALDLVVLYLTFIFFAESYIITGILLLLFTLVMGIFLLVIWDVIKQSGSKNYQIISGQGSWSVEYEFVGKVIEIVSKVNGENFCMVVPDMAIVPKCGETRNIKYEYVKIFEFDPPFGYGNIFISIDGKGLTNKHKNVIAKVKPIGILSVVLSISFCLSLLFCFLTEFKETWFVYISLGTFFVFARTIAIWNNNRNLRKSLNEEIS